MDLKFKNYIQSMKENGLLIEQQGKLKITDPAL
jgi:predicted transcriptional regulator